MPKGRPHKSIDDYFRSFENRTQWKKAIKLFLENQNNPEMYDGRYEATLIAADLHQVKGHPVNILYFQLDDKRMIEKRTALGDAESICEILFDFAKLGIVVKRPEQFSDAYQTITNRIPRVIISIQTINGLRSVKIEEFLRNGAGGPAFYGKGEVEVADGRAFDRLASGLPADIGSSPAYSPIKAEIEPEKPVLIDPEPIPGPVAKPEPQAIEVDLGKGDNIRARYRGEPVDGTIMETLETQNKLILLLENGDEIIVSADQIIAKLP